MREIVSPLSGIRSPLGPITSILPSYAVLGFKPQLVLDFDDEKYFTRSTKSTFSSAITHTRASTATYVDSTGTLQTAAINEPRVGHHVWNGSAWVNEGLLHESEARTNLLTYSEVVDGTGWSDSNSTSTNLTDGALGVWDGVSIATNGEFFAFLAASGAIAVTTGDVLTFRVWVKAGTSGRVRITLRQIDPTNTSRVRGEFGSLSSDLSSAGPITSIREEDWGNGIVAVSGTITVNFTGNLQFSIGPDSAVAGETVIAYAAQLEAAPTPSSYIPTSGSTVTRAADVLTIPAANLPYPEPVVIGPELVTNGTFDTDSDWTKGTGWTISGGAAHLDASVFGAGVYSDLRQNNIPASAGKLYQFSADVLSLTNATTAEIRARIISYPSATTLMEIDFLATGSAQGITTAVPSGDTIFTVLLLCGTNGDGDETASFDNISVREINPLAVSIQMDGRVTYADANKFTEARPVLWSTVPNSFVDLRVGTNSSDVGSVLAVTAISGSQAGSKVATSQYSPDVLVPINIGGRFTSNQVQSVKDGQTGPETSHSLFPDLSAANLTFGAIYNGTIRTFRIWGQDIGDAGLVEATEPSLVPSLSLTFDGTENSFIVEDWEQ